MFRLLGFPVHVRPGFVMLMVLIVVLYGDEFGIWLAGALAAFTLLHELGHATATRARGGEVHDMGIMLLVLMPVPYVDASAATPSIWWPP